MDNQQPNPFQSKSTQEIGNIDSLVTPTITTSFLFPQSPFNPPSTTQQSGQLASSNFSTPIFPKLESSPTTQFVSFPNMSQPSVPSTNNTFGNFQAPPLPSSITIQSLPQTTNFSMPTSIPSINDQFTSQELPSCWSTPQISGCSLPREFSSQIPTFTIPADSAPTKCSTVESTTLQSGLLDKMTPMKDVPLTLPGYTSSIGVGLSEETPQISPILLPFENMTYAQLDLYLDYRSRELDVKKKIFEEKLKRLNEIDLKLLKDDEKLSAMESKLSEIESCVVDINSELKFVSSSQEMLEVMLNSIESVTNTDSRTKNHVYQMLGEVEERVSIYTNEVTNVEERMRVNENESPDSLEYNVKSILCALMRSMDWIESTIVSAEGRISRCLGLLNSGR